MFYNRKSDYGIWCHEENDTNPNVNTSLVMCLCRQTQPALGLITGFESRSAADSDIRLSTLYIPEYAP